MDQKTFNEIVMFEIGKIQEGIYPQTNIESIWNTLSEIDDEFSESEIEKKIDQLLMQLLSLYQCLGNNIERLKSNMQDIMFSKGQKYANGKSGKSDRLINFNRPASKQCWPPVTICIGYLIKHIDSIHNIVESPENFSKNYILEKFTDACNYCIFLKILIKQ